MLRWRGAHALAIHHLAGPIHDSLEAQGMAELYDTIENPLVLVLAKMEHVGVGVDIDELRALNDELKAEVESLVVELRKLCPARMISTSTRRSSCANCSTTRRA